VTGYTDWNTKVRFPARAHIFLFALTSKPPPIQWVKGLFPRGQSNLGLEPISTFQIQPFWSYVSYQVDGAEFKV